MTTGERMKQRRKDIGMSAETIAQQLGVSPSTIYRYECGDIEKIPGDILAPLAKSLQTTQAWLMGWQDDPSGAIVDNILPMPKMKKVPLLGTIACGEPILAAENLEGLVNMPDDIHANFALRCKGDSMINARVFDGDIVYIRQQDTVENGEIAAVLVDDEATLKRVRLFDDHIVLEPENPMYKPLVYWGEEMNTIRILGKAVAFTSTMR